MIYKKDANFPYPILTNSSNAYGNREFNLDVNLKENTLNYIFEIYYNIESEFITTLIKKGKAQLILVIQSKDNKFFNFNIGQKAVEISKSRISLSKRTTLQMIIKTKEDIKFSNNKDLSGLYNEVKSKIVVPKNSILGFSESVLFDGSMNKPLELFEKKVDSKLKCDIKIELGSETIIISYKSEELQFSNSSMSQALNNPYIYMGLQKALYRFINSEGQGNEEVDLNDIKAPENGLEFKLYNLMRTKGVNTLNYENIDEVIYLISDKMLDKYTNAIRRMSS